MSVYLDTPALGWRLLRSMIEKAQPWMSPRMAADARWITSGQALSRPPQDGS
jgi:hypothetical protein